MPKKRQPSAEEMLRWLSRRAGKIVRDRMAFFPWTLVYGGIVPGSVISGPTLRAAIRAAMKADRTAGR